MSAFVTQLSLRSHVRSLLAAILLLVVGLTAGLLLARFPLNASTDVGGGANRVVSPAGGSSYQNYRVDERAELAPQDGSTVQVVEPSDTLNQQGWQQYRAGERGTAISPSESPAPSPSPVIPPNPATGPRVGPGR